MLYDVLSLSQMKLFMKLTALVMRYSTIYETPPDSDFCIFDYSKILILFQKIIGKLADTSINIKWGIRYLFISLKAVLKLAKEKFTMSSW